MMVKYNIIQLVFYVVLVCSVHAHTHIRNLIIDGKTLERGKCIRPYESKFNFPVKGVDNEQLVCRTTSMSASSTDTCDVKAGSTMTIEFHEETDRGSRAIEGKHYGPCIAYLSKMSSSGSPEGWFKIFEQGYDSKSKKWCIDDLNANDGQLDIQIPADIEDGDYILRGEIIALHLAEKKGGAEFYNNCVQLKVTGGAGTAKPALVKIPGVYEESDPGIYFNLYDGYSSYSIPGPKLYSPGAALAAVPGDTDDNSSSKDGDGSSKKASESSSSSNDDDNDGSNSKDSESSSSKDSESSSSKESESPSSSEAVGGETSKPKVPCIITRRRRRNFNVRRRNAAEL